MESLSTTKTIAMITNDDILFHVDEPVAMEFGVVKRYFDDNPDAAAAPVPLLKVGCKQRATIIAYCEGRLEFRSRGISADDAEVKAFDREFVSGQKPSELKDLTLAANYLEADEVLDLVNQALADHIERKSVEYVRRFFGIENDYAPEEELRLREVNAWAYEDLDPDLYDD